MASFFDQLERMAQHGWDGLDDGGATLKSARKQMADEERNERQRQAKIFRDCFDTPAGKLCLALLRQKTIDRPPTGEELAATDVAAFALMQARRQGAANLMFMIEAALAEEPVGFEPKQEQ